MACILAVLTAACRRTTGLLDGCFLGPCTPGGVDSLRLITVVSVPDERIVNFVAVFAPGDTVTLAAVNALSTG